MLGLGGREAQFAAVISATHLAQHFLSRLVPPLIPVLLVALEYPLWQLGLLISLFSFGSGLAQAPLGVLSDRYDRRYLLPSGIAIGGGSYLLFSAAPVFTGIVPSVSVLGHAFDGAFVVMSVSMIVLGFGTAVVHPVAYPMITTNVARENKGKVLGLFGSSAKLGDAAAPAIVGGLLLALAWEQILLLLGSLGIAFGVVLFAVLRSGEFVTTPSRNGAERGERGTEPETIWEAENRTYLYPMTVIYSFFVMKMLASNGVNTFLPTFLVSVYAFSFAVSETYLAPEVVANFYFAMLLAFAAVSQLILGGLTDKYDARTVLLCCVSVATVGLIGLASLDLSPASLLALMAILGAGLWGLNPARDVLISEITPPGREGRTFGYIWAAVRLTGSAIPILVGYVMDAMGMRLGFLLLAIGTALAGVSISLLFSDRVYLSDSVENAKDRD